MYYVYVIKNDKRKIYIGQTADLTNRLKRHNGELATKNKSYTYKNKGNWKIIYSETYDTRKEAMAREKDLKSHKGRDWIKEITTGL